MTCVKDLHRPSPGRVRIKVACGEALWCKPDQTRLSVVPVAVGWGVGLDGTLPRIRLSAADLTELGAGLYRLLAKFNGYVAAKVGWDPEGFLDPAELTSEWADELADGTIDGLVLCEALHDELGLGVA